MSTLVDTLQPPPTEDQIVQELQQKVSPSKLTLFQSCRLKFFFRYVKRLNKPEAIALHLGASVYSNVTIPPNHDLPKPGSVVEVRYLYAFKQSGAVYQPCYLGEREDIDPAGCTVAQLKHRCEPAATLRV